METKDPCENCDGFMLSDCCGAPCDTDVLICSDCKEHCSTWCDDCEDKTPDLNTAFENMEKAKNEFFEAIDIICKEFKQLNP